MNLRKKKAAVQKNVWDELPVRKEDKPSIQLPSTKHVETHAGAFPLRPLPVSVGTRYQPPPMKGECLPSPVYPRPPHNNPFYRDPYGNQGTNLNCPNRQGRFPVNVPLSPLDSRVCSPLAGAKQNAGATLKSYLAQNNISVQQSPSSVRPSMPSTSSGSNRKAVLVCLNYERTSGIVNMKSGKNDIMKLYDLLNMHLGFSKENIWVLSDQPRAVAGAICYSATRFHILHALEWLVKTTKRGDQLFFSFYGKIIQPAKPIPGMPRGEVYLGTQDYPTNDPIASCELFTNLVKQVPDGALLTVFFDCRGSEKLMRLPYLHSIVRERKKTFRLEEELEMLEGEEMTAQGLVFDSLLQVTGIRKGDLSPSQLRALENRNSAAMDCFDNGTVICIAARAEPELNPIMASSRKKTKNPGILTATFIELLEQAILEKEKMSLRKMLTTMAERMAKKKELRLPMMHASLDINPDMTFPLFEEF